MRVLAVAETTPNCASARTTPTKTIQRPIKTRRLKNADCEVVFFFIDGIMEFGLNLDF
jgi:hypothetical protein